MPAGENRRWQTLWRRWKWQTERNTASTAERFQSLIVAQDGVCNQWAQGRRCQQEGYRRHGIVRCGGCRATEKVLGCQVCGVAGDIHSPGWGAVGRWTQACSDCIRGCQATRMSETCGGCGRARAVRATVDGSGSCKDCAWGADAATVWIARGSRLCEHAAKQMGLLLSTQNMRDLVLSVARKWAERESFVSNVIRWRKSRSIWRRPQA